MGLGKTFSEVRWRWVLPVGLGVAVLTIASLYAIAIAYALVLQAASGGTLSREEIQQPAGAVARFAAVWVLPLVFVLLTAIAFALGVRRDLAPSFRDAIALGLAAAVLFQIAGRAFGPFSLREFFVYPVAGVLGAWLGVVLGRASLAGRESLYRASRAIGSAENPGEVAAAVGEHLAGSGDAVTLWRVSSRAAENGSPELDRLGAWSSDGGGDAWPLGGLDSARLPALSALKRQSPWEISPGDLPASEREAWGRMGLRSALLVPLSARGDGPDGLLVIASRGRTGFSRGKTRAYLTVGQGAALALENLRLVERARYSGMLGERKRLAREIHDTLIQGFASIVMNLEAAEGSLENGSKSPDPDLSRKHLDQARRTAREGLSEARRIVWALRPEALENAPLPEALRRLAGRWSGAGERPGTGRETAIDVTITGAARALAPEVEVTVLRAAQEALTNVRKHARAGRVVLTLSYMEDRVMLDVLDDGVGFETDGGNGASRGPDGGFGLGAMRERVEGAGGSLIVDSEPGRGTTLAINLPDNVSAGPPVGPPVGPDTGNGGLAAAPPGRAS